MTEQEIQTEIKTPTFKLVLPIEKSFDTGEDNEKKYYVSGIASGPEVDHHNERMAESALRAMKEAIESSEIPLRSSHKRDWEAEIGTIVEAELDEQNNLWITAELDKDSSVAMDMYRKLNRAPKPGKKPLQLALSIGGKITEYSREWNAQKQKFVRVLKNIILEEVSVVGSGAYPPAFVEVIQKSLDAIDPEADSSVHTEEISMENEKTQDTTVNVVIPETFTKGIEQLTERFDALMTKYDELIVEKTAEVAQGESNSETPADVAAVPTIEEIVAANVEVVKSAVAEAIATMKAEVVDPLVTELEVVKAEVQELSKQPVDGSRGVMKARDNKKPEAEMTYQERFQKALAENNNDPIRAAVKLAGVSDTAKMISGIS